MPRGDKSSYTDKQKRQAEHIEEGYEKRGVPDREAARRAWATVNKETHGGKKSGSGRGKAEDHAPSRKGAPGRTCSGKSPGRRPLALSEKGGRDPQAAGIPLEDLQKTSAELRSSSRRMIARRAVAAFHPRATGFCFTKGGERLDRNARVFAIDLICRASHRESRLIAVRVDPFPNQK
jgi:hypothetical protein